jgi:2-amino-4-hydroxy-6-hydroxymethyldihydropteridine diphosphokinase
MHFCFLLLGSNLGNKQDIIARALQDIESKIGEFQIKSGMYVSEPWGFNSADYFLNMVVNVGTNLPPQEVLEKIHEIESRFGRQRQPEAGYQSRTLDIDILFYDDLILHTGHLIIPHPRLHERLFTLEPLMEIAPGFIHPEFNKTVEELRATCPDELKVQKIDEARKPRS